MNRFNFQRKKNRLNFQRRKNRLNFLRTTIMTTVLSKIEDTVSVHETEDRKCRLLKLFNIIRSPYLTCFQGSGQHFPHLYGAYPFSFHLDLWDLYMQHLLNGWLGMDRSGTVGKKLSPGENVSIALCPQRRE